MTDNAIPKDIKVGIDLKLTAGADASEIEQVMEKLNQRLPYNMQVKDWVNMQLCHLSIVVVTHVYESGKL